MRTPALHPEVPGCRESETGVQSLSEKVVEGRVYGVVEARDPRPTVQSDWNSAKKSVTQAPPAVSEVDFVNAFSSRVKRAPRAAPVSADSFRRRWPR